MNKNGEINVTVDLEKEEYVVEGIVKGEKKKYVIPINGKDYTMYFKKNYNEKINSDYKN